MTADMTMGHRDEVWGESAMEVRHGTAGTMTCHQSKKMGPGCEAQRWALGHRNGSTDKRGLWWGEVGLRGQRQCGGGQRWVHEDGMSVFGSGVGAGDIKDGTEVKVTW